MNDQHVSSTQTAILLFLTILPTAFLLVPSIIAQIAGNSAWLVILLIPPLFSYIILRVILRLGNLFPGQTFIQYSELLLGKWLGKTLSLLYILSFHVLNITFLRECSAFLALTYYPSTPAWFIHLVIMTVAVYATDKGIEVIMRMGEFLFPLFIGGALLGPILLIPELRFTFLLPFLEEGIAPLFQAAIIPSYILGETIVLAFFLPFINKPQQLKRKCLYSIWGAALITSFQTAVAIMVLGPELTASLDVPSYELARYIEYRYYLQRIDTLLTAIWTVIAILKACLVHYLICLSVQQLLGLKTTRPVNIPLALAQSFAAWYLFPNEESLLVFMKENIPMIALPSQLGIPLVLLGIAFLKTKLQNFLNPKA